jgi:Lon protease-like protein
VEGRLLPALHASGRRLVRPDVQEWDMADEPVALPMFPLSIVLFPGGILPLHVFEPRYRQMTMDCLAAGREFGVVLISRGSEVGGGDERVSVGTLARIERAGELPDGRWVLVTRGTRRLRVVRWLADDPYPRAEVTMVDEPDWSGDAETLDRANAALRRARALLSELGTLAAVAEQDLEADGPTARSWRLCGAAPVPVADAQRLLATDDPGDRMTLLAELCDERSDDARRMLAMGSSG